MKITISIILLIFTLKLLTGQEPVEKLGIVQVLVTDTKGGKNNGSINVNVNGGLAPYTLTLNTGAKTKSATGNLKINGLPSGKYWIVIEDQSSQSQFKSSIVIK